MLAMNLTSVIESKASTDAALDGWLSKIASHDMEALSELYYSTSATVYAFALSILKNTQDAEDVLHDCYVNIFFAASTYRSAGKPLAWIMTITRNLCLQKFRVRQKIENPPPEDWESYLAAQTNISPEDKLVLEECMNRLSDEERQIVLLHAVNGFKHREIADILSLPLPTVLSKYSRALKKLKQYLKRREIS